MYTEQRLEPYAVRPRQTRRRKRRSPLPLLATGLILGVCLGWTLRGAFSAQAAGSPVQTPQAGSDQPDSSGSPAPSPDRSAPLSPQTPPDCPDWIEQDFLSVNEYSRPGTALDAVTGVVVHYVGNPGTTARQNRSYFQTLAQTHEAYASSHFLIGLEGEILQNIPLDEVAYCSNQRNNDTISIECCHPDADGAFTQETYDSLIKLVRWLMEYYHLDSSQVIRHYDVTGKECPLYYVRHPGDWEAFLADLN